MWHRPVGDRARNRLIPAVVMGSSMTLAPPASAKSHSPFRNAWQPKCVATNDDEHVVFTNILGPLGPSQ